MSQTLATLRHAAGIQCETSSSDGSSSGVLGESVSADSEVMQGSGSWCPRYSHTGYKGEIMVVTPWYPYGADKGSLRLAGEIEDFVEFMKLTVEERKAVTSVRRLMQEIAAATWPESTVKEIGGLPLNAVTPASAIELVIESCGEDIEAYDTFKKAILERGYTIKAEDCRRLVLGSPGGSPDTIVWFETVTESGQCRKEVHTLSKIVKDVPNATQVMKVLETVMKQMKYTDVTNGGLSPIALLVMCIVACRLAPNPNDVGSCLAFFLQFFSTFDFSAHTLTPYPESPVIPRVAEHVAAPVSILSVDPYCINVSSECTRIVQIKAHFQYSSMALGKWVSPLAPTNKKQARGYKGRTPLSLIVPLQPLWARAEAALGTEIVRKFQ